MLELWVQITAALYFFLCSLDAWARDSNWPAILYLLISSTMITLAIGNKKARN
jgi:hypothetical protein